MTCIKTCFGEMSFKETVHDLENQSARFSQSNQSKLFSGTVTLKQRDECLDFLQRYVRLDGIKQHAWQLAEYEKHYDALLDLFLKFDWSRIDEFAQKLQQIILEELTMSNPVYRQGVVR